LHAIIFANSYLEKAPVVQPGDLIIAADGGARHCLALDLLPFVVIGDMDSIDSATEVRLEAAGVEIIRHPARKDYTDLELALIYAVERKASQVSIYAALGNRWDQTLANLLLPALEDFEELVIRLIDGEQEIQLIKPGRPVIVRGAEGDTVSLVPIGGEVFGITTHGLEYSLQDGSLSLGSSRGISNVMLGKHAEISIADGLLVCVHIHQS
jgi:thiamine pyrophosphokinase